MHPVYQVLARRLRYIPEIAQIARNTPYMPDSYLEYPIYIRATQYRCDVMGIADLRQMNYIADTSDFRQPHLLRKADVYLKPDKCGVCQMHIRYTAMYPADVSDMYQVFSFSGPLRPPLRRPLKCARRGPKGRQKVSIEAP